MTPKHSMLLAYRGDVPIRLQHLQLFLKCFKAALTQTTECWELVILDNSQFCDFDEPDFDENPSDTGDTYWDKHDQAMARMELGDDVTERARINYFHCPAESAD